MDDMINIMLTIQELHTYHQLAEAGLVKYFDCPLDKDHPYMIPYMDHDDNIYLMCLACSSKRYLGERLENAIKKII